MLNICINCSRTYCTKIHKRTLVMAKHLKIITNVLIGAILFSAPTFAERLDIGSTLPLDLGKTFEHKEISYEKFKGQQNYILVWDGSNPYVLSNLLKNTKDTPAPVIVFCTGYVKLGSRKKDYKSCEYQEGVINSDRVTMLYSRSLRLENDILLPKATHLFISDESGKITHKSNLQQN